MKPEAAKRALKPAIADLASTDEDFFFEQLIKQYLSLGTQARRFGIRRAQQP